MGDMGKKSREKKERKAMLETAGTAGTKQVTGQGNPTEFNNIIVRPLNSVVNLRGGDSRCELPTGELLITCDKYAIIPLEMYERLVRMAKRNKDHVLQKLGESKIAEPSPAAVAAAKASRNDGTS